jgi:hypothetical protein
VSAANAAEGLGINTITVTIALATTTRKSMREVTAFSSFE